ncbi:GDSL-type esterase/lipase family protein [Sulfurospirillum arcachonense]|uniref:GDSL-type esterase/lipase family protein n=1 Tax=Sulfurospirillum arcachonense TaxID=57666 RepID=UPI000469E4AE|nr:GDSL-type esterase/lipase family protein [Sulfurospirillum arcachonense]
MNISKIIFLAIIGIIFFQFINSTDEEFDGAIMLPLDTKILAFGDSITYGYHVDKDKSYPTQLSKLLNTEVINAGVNGEMSNAGLKRLPTLLEKYKPQILIICHGGNDILRKKSLLKAKENIANMIKIAQEKKIQVFLIGVPTLEVLTLSTAEIYHELSTEFGVPLDSETLEDILSDNTLKIDQIHPNEDGYRILSNHIATLVTENYLPPQAF